jgi:hypothetical protein
MLLLKPEENISESTAMDFLIDLALYSNYRVHGRPPLASVSDVAAYLAQRGTSIPDAAATMVVYREPPRYFYNLIGPTWIAQGVKVSRVDAATGEEKVLLDGDGQYHEAIYWAKFDQSFSDFERAVKDGNHELLLSAFAKGQAAIENFLNVLNVPGIKDCSVEEKLKKVWELRPRAVDWSVARTREPWCSFIEMKRIRNKQEIHNKEGAGGFKFTEMHAHFLLYSRAIPKMLLELHKLTGQRCPASIIRASYYPPIALVPHTQPGPAPAAA